MLPRTTPDEIVLIFQTATLHALPELVPWGNPVAPEEGHRRFAPDPSLSLLGVLRNLSPHTQTYTDARSSPKFSDQRVGYFANSGYLTFVSKQRMKNWPDYDACADRHNFCCAHFFSAGTTENATKPVRFNLFLGFY